MLLLILVAFFLSWLTWYFQRAKEQQEVAEWIRSVNRTAVYDSEIDAAGQWNRNAKSIVAPWLIDLLGKDFFSTVVLVHLDDRPIGDISKIANLRYLKHFELSNGQINDISPLQNLVELEHISISRNPISDISALAHLPKLKRLIAYQTEIDDLTALRELKELQVVWLADTEITNLSPLSDLPNLNTLNISGTAVNDLSPLFGLNSLVEVDVSNTDVTKEDVEELQKHLPSCKIKY